MITKVNRRQSVSMMDKGILIWTKEGKRKERQNIDIKEKK